MWGLGFLLVVQIHSWDLLIYLFICLLVTFFLSFFPFFVFVEKATTDQPRNGSTTAPGPKSCRQQVGMSCCALLLDFDTVDMLTKINKHVFCKAPSSSVCPSCLRQDNQSRSQSLFDVRAACLHVVLFFSCCRVRVWPDVLTDLPFLNRRCAPKSTSLFFVAAAT